MMKRTQKGMGVIGLLFTLGMIAIVTLLVLKLTPVYIEYFTVKKAVAAVARSGSTSPQDIRRAFEKQADIDQIDIIKASDITVSGNNLSFAYDKQVHLFANISLLIEFEGYSTVGSGARF